MKPELRVLAAAGSLSLAFFAADAAFAQKAGGILKISHFDSPASMSLLEESTAAALRPMMGVFNNLVVYDQHVAQNSMIRPPSSPTSAGLVQPHSLMLAAIAAI